MGINVQGGRIDCGEKKVGGDFNRAMSGFTCHIDISGKKAVD